MAPGSSPALESQNKCHKNVISPLVWRALLPPLSGPLAAAHLEEHDTIRPPTQHPLQGNLSCVTSASRRVGLHSCPQCTGDSGRMINSSLK